MFLSHSEIWGFQPAHQSLSPITVSLRRFYRSAKSGTLESDSVNQGLPGPRLGGAREEARIPPSVGRALVQGAGILAPHHSLSEGLLDTRIIL